MYCRYIVCKVEFGRRLVAEFGQQDVYMAIRKELQLLHGEYALTCSRKFPQLSGDYILSQFLFCRQQ